jgi:hypothetical protein
MIIASVYDGRSGDQIARDIEPDAFLNRFRRPGVEVFLTFIHSPHS